MKNVGGTSRTALDRFMAAVEAGVAEDGFVKLSISGPASLEGVERVTVRRIALRGVPQLSFVMRHAAKEVTVNAALDEGGRRAVALLKAGCRAAHLQLADTALELAWSRGGRITLRRPPRGATPDAAAPDAPAVGHDRPKTRWVDVQRPYLQALGVTDAAHRVVPAMARKWKQINKFVELFDGALERAGLTATQAADGPGPLPPCRVVDFGAGKGYLTFALHDHLTSTLRRPAEVTGIELRADLADAGDALAARLRLTGLRFAQGDVRTQAPAPVDAVIALHACDTATDHALFLGVSSGARIIMCSPCCHKELRPQLLAPHPLAPLLRHGVHLGQQADMVTDGLRALLLEACGYATQVFEFVALEHSQKNKMILAVRRSAPVAAEAAWQQIDDLKAFYGVRTQCFEALLRAKRGGGPTGAVSTTACS